MAGREVALRVEVRGMLPLDLNALLRLSSNQRGATRARRQVQMDQALLMRSQNQLPREPLQGPLHVRYTRRHRPRKAVDIDNAAAGLKTIIDALVDEGVLPHDGPSVLPVIEHVGQEVVHDDREQGFLLELVRP